MDYARITARELVKNLSELKRGNEGGVGRFDKRHTKQKDIFFKPEKLFFCKAGLV